jgi:hypothetical protein
MFFEYEERSTYSALTFPRFRKGVIAEAAAVSESRPRIMCPTIS